MQRIIFLLFITGLISIKTAAQKTNIFNFDSKYTANNTIGNSTQFSRLNSNTNTSILLTKPHNWSQPNISGTSSISNSNFWKAQGNGGGQVGKGALIGMGVGAVLGGLIGLISYQEPPAPPKGQIVFYSSDLGPGGSAAIGALAGLASGGLLGAFIGLAIENNDY